VVVAGSGWRVSGLLRIDEVASETGYRAPEGEYETIGGLVLEQLGHIPEVGDTVELPALDADGLLDDVTRWQATVVQMEGRRIDQLQLSEIDEPEAAGPTGRDHR
jgi:CBS domain containing-hemolysin-like protein